jgi:hypothetical protein
MPLHAGLAAENFGQPIMGHGFSKLAVLGMELGPRAGGWVFDIF